MERRCGWQPLLLALLILLPQDSVGDPQRGRWGPGSDVRVATGPTLHPAPQDAPHADVLPTLAHGYAALVSRHSGLVFVDTPVASSAAGMAAVCEGRADLVLVQGAGNAVHLPCPNLVASRSFHGGASVLVGRAGERLPSTASDLDALLVAAVEGGPYPPWLAEHHPGTRVLPMPNLQATLTAVQEGVADVAIGLESPTRAQFRRHFAHSLRLQALDARFPTQLHLLARREDKALLERIEAALAEITVEEHAALLQRWTGQALPAAIDQVFGGWMARAAPWLIAVAITLVLAALLAACLLRSGWGRERNAAQAAGMISHEVRNSAQAVLASIDLLGQSPLPAGPRELVTAAENASQTLRRLLDRTLDFSRLASGTFRPQLQPCDVPALCAQALAAVAPQAQRKALSLEFGAPEAPFPIVSTDADCLRQLLDNLLGNAIKFTDVGGVELRLQLEERSKATSLLIEVIDSGIGIAPTQMHALFEPFRQAEGGTQRGGSGLGLSICRELATALGGTLNAHSVHGRGSRFILRLPVQRARPEAVAGAVDDRHPLEGLRILLVEDHDLNRQMIAAQLRHWGATVCAAADAATALELQHGALCPVILLDIGLPGIDGYGLARQLRQREADGAPRALLLALSAFTGDSHALRCRAAGIDAVLVKPLQIDALLAALGLTRLSGSPLHDVDQELADAYEADIDKELQYLLEAIDQCDAEALQYHAHRLQGVLQMRGAGDIDALAGELEAMAKATTPVWDDVRRLLQAALAQRGSRTAEATPRP